MKTKHNNDGAVPRHLEDDDLVSYLDGELSREEQEQARLHLESCWGCRSLLNVAQSSIENFMRLRQETLLPGDLPPSGPAIDVFRRRLAEHNASAQGQARFSLDFARVRLALSRFTQSLQFERLAFTDSPFAIRAAVFLFAGVIIAALAIYSNRVTTVSASELLQRASDAQAASLRSMAEPVVHQKLQVRRRALRNEVSVGWEVWTDMKNSRSRQFVTEGESGAGVVHDLAQVLQANHMDPQRPLSAASYGLWRNALAEKQEEITRTKLLGGFDALTLRTTAVGSVNAGQITEAVLVVRVADWRPIEQRLSIKAEGGGVIYELTETASEVVSLAHVNPSIFAEPFASTSSSQPETPNSKLETRNSKPEIVTPAPVATAELEVEVLRLLNQAGADLGEQVSAKRHSDGLLRVEGIVETEARKAEILSALAPVRNDTAVRVDIKTVAEALAEKRRQGRDAPRSATEQKVEIESGAVAAEAELRSYFKSDEEARQFAARMVSRSQRAMRHLYALRRLSNQFSAEELRALESEARAKWLSLIRSHARAYLQEASGLRRELQLIFSATAQSTGTQVGRAIDDPAEVVQAVERLFELGSANDRVILLAFTTSSERSTVTAIKTGAFWQSLSAAEVLASRIQSAQ
jgi:hypothetical protein